MLKLNYETLFEIDIRHHYHLDDGELLFDTLTPDAQFALQNNYDITDFFSIGVPPATSTLLASHHAVCKITSTGLIAGLRTVLNGSITQPEIVPADTTVFNFSIDVVDGLFANYSALPLQSPFDMVYYFTNDSSFSPRVFPFISATPGLYATGTNYYQGDTLVDNQAAPSKLFIAQQKNNLDPNQSATPAGNWITDTQVGGKPLMYSGAQDMVRRVGRVFNYQVTVPGKLPNLTITDRLGNNINVNPVIETGVLNTLKVDMSSFPEGLYRASIATADASYTDNFPFYYTLNSSAWAFIDIGVKPGNSAYNLFNSDGSLASPLYSLHFKNRATFWRYIGSAFGAASISDSALPLTRQGFITVKVKDKNNNLTADELPNPSASMIRPETNQIFSEIFM